MVERVKGMFCFVSDQIMPPELLSRLWHVQLYPKCTAVNQTRIKLPISLSL